MFGWQKKMNIEKLAILKKKRCFIYNLLKIGALMNDDELTDKELAAFQLADIITATLKDISEKLELPVSILIEDLVPHQPFLVAKMWTDDEGLLNSVSEKTKEAVFLHSEPSPNETFH